MQCKLFNLSFRFRYDKVDKRPINCRFKVHKIIIHRYQLSNMVITMVHQTATLHQYKFTSHRPEHQLNSIHDRVQALPMGYNYPSYFSVKLIIHNTKLPRASSYKQPAATTSSFRIRSSLRVERYNINPFHIRFVKQMRKKGRMCFA